MCEILMMYKINGEMISKKEVKRFLYKCIKSGDSNPDGYGVVWESGIFKEPVQFKEEHIQKIMQKYKGDSRFFILHVRYATSPINLENTHPFDMDSFIGVHNGVVHVDGINTGVDSHDMFTAIQRDGSKTLKEKIIGAMTKISGTYSVMIYNRDNESLYYYRNTPSFDFLFSKKDGIVYGATNIERLYGLCEKLLGFFETTYESRPIKNVLYRIDLKSGWFNREGTVSEKAYVVLQSRDNRKDIPFVESDGYVPMKFRCGGKKDFDVNKDYLDDRFYKDHYGDK